MRPVFIYALLDPLTEETRYVGQTVNPDRRLVLHLCQTRKYQHYSARWVRSLLAKGLKPVMEILDVVPDTEADFWECEYIQNFRERGFDLTNFSDGGKTPMRGKKCSSETRAKISAAQKGKAISPETCAKMSASAAGKVISPETRVKISASLVGRKRSPEHCAALSGRKRSLETRAKISTAKLGEKNPMFGKKFSPEHRAKMSASRTGKKRKKFSPEHRAKIGAANRKRRKKTCESSP